ncbi:unnamed protein product [Notodromas monacha]|uniref:Transcription initiation factor TFIID subunit 8 n=1 Tax=Notodromas monacha TaxID=399045 RepID=A0A7R9GAQ6_9CRUS|nr:unnamed protein product [Notodromas monacha]CAG0915685.1 unnamed protein product [Notodromas monacha]
MESSSSVVPVNPYRRILTTGIGAAALSAGFRTVSRSAAETLTEMVLSFLSELGRSSKTACELAGRTVPVANDVIFSLIEMGISVPDLIRYFKTSASQATNKKKFVVPTPSSVPVPVPPAMLHVDGPTAPAKKKRLRSNIPDYYPDFPDPHTYIWTPTYKQPVTDYLTIRDKAANQKRDVEKALCRFIAKTESTSNLFLESDDGPTLLPVISVESAPLPYIRAMLFKDQYFNEEIDEESEFASSKPKRKRKAAANTSRSLNTSLLSDCDGDNENDENGTCASPSPATPAKDASENAEQDIENPFLRSPKLPLKFSSLKYLSSETKVVSKSAHFTENQEVLRESIIDAMSCMSTCLTGGISVADALRNGFLRRTHEQNAEALRVLWGFSVEKRPSAIEGGGHGVFLTGNPCESGHVVCLYPGTIYRPGEPILIQSLGNSFVLRCCDGVLIDGSAGWISAAIYKSCVGRDKYDLYRNSADLSWLSSFPEVPFNIGQYVNNGGKDKCNVMYQELDVHPGLDFPPEFLPFLPNIPYSGSIPRRLVALIATRVVFPEEELLSSYFTVIKSS